MERARGRLRRWRVNGRMPRKRGGVIKGSEEGKATDEERRRGFRGGSKARRRAEVEGVDRSGREREGRSRREERTLESEGEEEGEEGREVGREEGREQSEEEGGREGRRKGKRDRKTKGRREGRREGRRRAGRGGGRTGVVCTSA